MKKMTKKEKVILLLKHFVNFIQPFQHHLTIVTLIPLNCCFNVAQSTDVRVNQITPKLFARAKTPYEMVKLSVEEIREIIRPVGLSPMKSKGIFGLSKILIEKYKGKVPKSYEELESLPSVGHKTAAVVLAQAFGIQTFPVDTHIHRFMYRWGFSNGKNVVQTERDAKRLFPKELWNDLHLQIIWYGREYSPDR